MKRRQFLKNTFQFVALTSPLLSWSQRIYAGTRSLIDQLKEISRHIFFFDDPEFQSLKEIVNKNLKPEDPLAILKSSSVLEMKNALEIGSSSGTHLRVRSGGHSFEGFSMGAGLVIDVRELNQIIIEEENNRVVAESGVNLDRLRHILDLSGYSFPTGSCPTVGLAGYILGGGHSKKSRLWGLGADRVQGMDVILANGEEIHVTPKENQDLYWALLGGGGGNFGLVTRFYLDLIPKTKDISFNLWAVSEFEEIFSQWEDFMTNAPLGVSPTLIFSFKNGEITRANLSGLLTVNFDEGEDLQQVFKRSVPESLWKHFKFKKYSFKKIDRYKPISKHVDSKSSFKGTSHYADSKIGKMGFREVVKALSETCKTSKNGRLEFLPLGGRVLRPDRENSYPHRQSLYSVALFIYVTNKEFAVRDNGNLESLRLQIEPLFSGRHYVNYPDRNLSRISESDWAIKYYGESLDRLIEIKKAYDPNNAFDYGQHSLASLT